MRALVTGAGLRVGRAIAVELARHGFEVAVHYRSSRQEAEFTVDLCRDAGGDAFLVQGDLCCVEDVGALADAVRSRWDSLDVLVHNASVFEPVPFEEVSLDHLERMHALHVRAPFLLTQALLPLLRVGGSTMGSAPGEGGLVVAMCDVGADRPMPGFSAYCISKAGLVMLVKALAVELAPAVRCVGISPGVVAWPPDYDEERRRSLTRRIPMGRAGDPLDVARLVRFVALEAPFLNGVVLPVDGGQSVRP